MLVHTHKQIHATDSPCVVEQPNFRQYKRFQSLFFSLLHTWQSSGMCQGVQVIQTLHKDQGKLGSTEYQARLAIKLSTDGFRLSTLLRIVGNLKQRNLTDNKQLSTAYYVVLHLYTYR